ncbi:MAG: hypothetical protein ACRDTF_04025 [Pseudonocardiaceae bacterium]
MPTRVLDPRRFPALLRAVEDGAFDPGDDPAADRDDGFAFGLARILDGVERLIQDRTHATSPTTPHPGPAGLSRAAPPNR